MKIFQMEPMLRAFLDACRGLMHHAKAQRHKVLLLNTVVLHIMCAGHRLISSAGLITLSARKGFLRIRSGDPEQVSLSYQSPLIFDTPTKSTKTKGKWLALSRTHSLTPHASRLTTGPAQDEVDTATYQAHAPLTSHVSRLTICAAMFFLLFTSLSPAHAQQKNIIFIIADDHRYDAMGFMNKIPWLETPGLDRMAKEGMHIKNAYVTTALCSPSRASVLTGMYAHSHTVVDNTAPEPEDILYFPQLLQKKGYQTAFFGKWHMGNEGDHPRKGFHHWEGLRGQGEYYNPTLNINGKRTKFTDSTYIADLITDHALGWMKQQKKSKPFFVYLSHKGVHAMFQPAKRHKGIYKDKPVPLPPSYYLTATDEYKEHGIPEWVKEQRYSWHGVDYMYHGEFDFETFYRSYLETLLSVDESVGRVLDYLEENGLDENTLVMYMGDNGFSFGEHGLIDKRHAYEESMRVPMLVTCPSVIKAGSVTEALVQNIDVGPTLLEYAGVSTPERMQGKSFMNVLNGKAPDHRDRIFYEYYWEYHYPQTPTMFAVRNGDYKYIHYYGLWSQNELYDLKNDPYEMNNLIADPKYRALTKDLSTQVFDWLQSTNGMQIPLKRNNYPKIDHKYKGQY